jgi:integrase
VSKALDPWKGEHRRTAEKIRGRIERVLDYATAAELRSGDNPATIKLQRHLGLKAAEKHIHYAALPADDVPDLMGELDDLGSATCKALQFTILTAARSGEVIGATWSEIDLAAKTWTVAGERMKEGREHTVPLTAEAIAVLGKRGAPNAPLFANKRGKPLHDHAMQERLKTLRTGCTVHGFRSVASGFWAKREVSKELRDLCLAHSVGGKTFQAYNRDELIDLRRPIMEMWAEFATGKALAPLLLAPPIAATIEN